MQTKQNTQPNTVYNLSDQKLDELSKDSSNIVYKYKDQPAVAKSEVLPLARVRRHISDLWVQFSAIPNHNQLSQQQLQKVRRKFSRDPEFVLFAQNYPSIFERVVGQNTTEAEIGALYYMLDLKASQNEGKLKDGQEMLQRYVMDTFSMSKEQYKAKYPDSRIMDVPPPPKS